MKRTVAMIALVLAAACSVDTGFGDNLLDDPRWRSLVAEMKLRDYEVERLNTFVRILQDSRIIIKRADDSTRSLSLVGLDREIARALPLLVPPAFTDRVHAFLMNAMSGR
jgi:hypothetical protein